MEKKRIKIKFVDVWHEFNCCDNYFTRVLSTRFDVEISDNPDYIFYSCFGNEYLKYHCIRIYFTGECVTPDFNLCDYALGFDYITFEDRYCRAPIYYWNYPQAYEKAKRKHENVADGAAQNKEFCCMVVSNGNGQKERKEIFDLLSAYKPVASGGKWLNNVGGPVKDKLEFCSRYKFSLAFENMNNSGYTTEKIVESFAAGTVPIYFGDPNVETEFNSKAFVNCAAFPSLQEAVEYIKYLDTNDDAYAAMLREPMELGEKDNKLDEFLLHIFSQEFENAYRRPKNGWVANVEKNANLAVDQQRLNNRFLRRAFRKMRRILHGMKTTN